MTTESVSDNSVVSTPLALRPNKRLMRSARLTRLGLAAVFVVLAALESDSIGRALASLVAFLLALGALLIPRAGAPDVVALDAGLENRFFGLLRWDDVAAFHVRDKRGVRSLEIYDRDRKATIRRTRPRLLKLWMIATQSLHLPLLRITERMASFDAVEFRAELERLADRAFPER
jgi:hypothetical protein